MRIIIAGRDESTLTPICEALKAELGISVVRSLADFTGNDWCIFAVPHNALRDPATRSDLRRNSIVILLADSPDPPSDELWYIDGIVDVSESAPEDIAERILESIQNQLALRSGQPNTFGEIIRVTTFGESHGRAIGAILDGIKPGIEISEADIQSELDRRKPGQSRVTTSRRERDRVQILSGVFEGRTTGAPIAMALFNTDIDSTKYETIKNLFRPGHADFTYYRKYGIRDYRGGGRSSGRETASRVACGAVARKLLGQKGIGIRAHAVEIAGISSETCDYNEIEKNAVRCADPKAAARMESAILDAKEQSDSVGGIVRLDIDGVPAGLGDPVFFKLDARLCHAIMTLGAIKAVEVGRGFELARLRGSESNDQMTADGFISNNAGGISGGISTGQRIYLRIAVKPTSSIAQTQRTIDKQGRDAEIKVEGRHDPCIVPRIIPVIESMAALVLLDALKIQKRIRSIDSSET